MMVENKKEGRGREDKKSCTPNTSNMTTGEENFPKSKERGERVGVDPPSFSFSLSYYHYYVYIYIYIYIYFYKSAYSLDSAVSSFLWPSAPGLPFCSTFSRRILKMSVALGGMTPPAPRAP